MKNDIIINYSIIEDIVGDIFQYKSALETMEESLKNMKDVLESENSGKAVDVLVERYEKLQSYINSCKEELTDLYGLFAGYYEDMITYIKPTKKSDNVRVDRLDIYLNLQSILYAIQDIRSLKSGSNYINAFSTSTSNYSLSDNLQVSYGWHPDKIVNGEEKKNEEDNYRKLQEIKELIGRYASRITERGEVMEDLFNNKIVYFEEMDNTYSSKVAPIYNKYTSVEETRANLKTKQDENIKKAWDAICNSFKSAFELIGGIADYTKGAEAVWNAKILGKEMTPLDKYYAEKYYQGNEIIKAIYENPSILIEGMAQQMSDDLDQKGLAYVTGSIIGDYLLFKIGKGIKVKVANIESVEKVLEKVSAVINKLKTKFDDIFDIVEETVDKGDSIIFKLGDGSETTITKAELKAQGISDSAIQYCIDGCFVGDTLVLTNKGLRRIDEIEVGDFVYATDVKTGDKKYKEVLQVHKRNTYEFVKLNIEGEEIITTPGHLFYTYEGIWKIAGDLKPGDEILSSDGQAKKVISVEEELLKETERIYNLSIEGYNTYYVSKISLLVHNQKCDKTIKGVSKTKSNIATIFEKEDLSELKDVAKYIKQHDDYLEVVLKDGISIKISKSEIPPNSFEKLDQFILSGDEAEFKSTYKIYEEARKRGFEDADIIAKKTGINVEDIKSVISHVFLEKHDIPAQGGFVMKNDYLTPNDEIAYAWNYAKEMKNELTDNQKEWFKEWVTHEKQESKAMNEEGLPLRRIESWDGATYTGDPPGAHDKALKQKLEFDGYTSWFAREIMKQ